MRARRRARAAGKQSAGGNAAGWRGVAHTTMRAMAGMGRNELVLVDSVNAGTNTCKRL